MRKILTTIVFASLFLIINTANAQVVYVLQNGSKVQFLEKVSDVRANIENGDTLYLPAKTVPADITWQFDKQVHIIGAGYHPDSTKTTGITLMQNDLYFKKGSKGSSITGVRIENNVYIQDSAITVSRCNMKDIYIQNGSEPISQTYITDCVLRGNLNGGNNVVTNCLIERCVMHGQIGEGDRLHNMMIKNCILTYNGSYNSFPNLHNLSIVNSIILDEANFIFCSRYGNFNCSGLTLNNNLWVRTGLYSSAGFIMNENVWGVPLEDIFEDFENEDYRIKSTCEQALTMADDGKQVGIYGTDEPFLVPTFAPRFTSIDNAKKVVDGKLSVKMQVEARDR